MLDPLGRRRRRFPDARFPSGARVGVASVQHESNSFAPGATELDAFNVVEGDHLGPLGGSNTELAGAVDELAARDATAVPLLWAHALPSAPLSAGAGRRLVERLERAVRAAGRLDAVVLCLHGAATTEVDPSLDRTLLDATRAAAGDGVPVALTLDLHANVTARLLDGVTVTVGYATNPHVDQRDTGRRSVELLAAAFGRTMRPVTAVASCPALFPDETLRLPGGVLERVLTDGAAGSIGSAGSIVEIGVFPTQPWLDVAGSGFTVAVTSDDDRTSAAVLAEQLVSAVWERRHEFVVPELTEPTEALRRARRVATRPAVITESADAPTAGAAGDGTGVLSTLLGEGFPGRVVLTVVDPAAVSACDLAGRDATVELVLGAHVDPRWSQPVGVQGTVRRVGDGTHRLLGVGYGGVEVTMGRFAVVAVELDGPGLLELLVTERPAWSGDPGPWEHAELDPWSADLLVVRSCTDYLANFPHAAGEPIIADVAGPAPSRLTRLRFERIDPLPHPLRTWTTAATVNAIITDHA